MKFRVVCYLTVWACAFLTTSYVMAAAQSDNSEGQTTLDEASYVPLVTVLDSLRAFAGDDIADEEDEDTFLRRRRMLNGLHSRNQGSGSRFRNRPRVYIPRIRPGNKGSSRNNVSPY